jgi:hypothetical protein
VLIAIGFVAAVFLLFYKPFAIALPALIVTMAGVSISDKYRRLGLYATAAITLCFLIGASFAAWDSRALY